MDGISIKQLIFGLVIPEIDKIELSGHIWRDDCRCWFSLNRQIAADIQEENMMAAKRLKLNLQE